MSDTGRPVKAHRSGGGIANRTRASATSHSTETFAAAVATDFNVDTPKVAYDCGRDAYFCSHMPALSDNPYALGTAQHKQWAQGFTDAHSDDAE